MHYGVVDAGAARRGTAYDAAANVFRSEIIQRQRLFALGDKMHRLVNIIEGDHRQHGPEDLLLHDRRRRVDVCQQRRFDIQLPAPHAAACDNVAVIHVCRYAVERPLVHHAYEMAVLTRVVAVHATHLAPESLGETLPKRTVDHQVIGRNACLSRIEGLAPHNAPRRQLHVGAAVDDAGALAPEFQHHGRKILRRRTHHDTPQRRAPREEYHVVTLPEQASVHLAVTLNHGYVAFVEGLRDHALDGQRHVRHIGRRFQQGRTSRRDGADKRVQQQLNGIVPRRHDKRTPQRLAHDTAARGKHLQRRGAPLPPHPPFEVAQMVADLTRHDAQFGQYGLLLRLVQVLPQSLA